LLPSALAQALMSVIDGLTVMSWNPPWCISTTMTSAPRAQRRGQLVDRLDLVVEREARDAARRHDRRRLLQRHADEADAHAADRLDVVRGKQRLARRVDLHVGRQELELRTLERHRRADLRALAGVGVAGEAAAVLHAQQLGAAVVELVVADAVEVQAQQVHRLDGRLVVEQRRDQRARAKDVAGRDDQRVRVRGLRRRHIARHLVDAARRHRRRVDVRAERARRDEIAVEVVEGDQLDRRDLARVGDGRERGKGQRCGERLELHGEASWGWFERHPGATERAPRAASAIGRPGMSRAPSAGA